MRKKIKSKTHNPPPPKDLIPFITSSKKLLKAMFKKPKGYKKS